VTQGNYLCKGIVSNPISLVLTLVLASLLVSYLQELPRAVGGMVVLHDWLNALMGWYFVFWALASLARQQFALNNQLSTTLNPPWCLFIITNLTMFGMALLMFFSYHKLHSILMPVNMLRII
jgi:hypothetical protein